MSSITSANAILMIGVASLFPVAQRIEGFAADEMFDFDQIESAEAQIGVDARLTGGYVASMQRGSLTLQADSPSNDFFDAWNLAQNQAKDIYYGFAVLTMPSLSKKWTLTKGILTTWQAIPSAGKLLRPRKYAIAWESAQPAPV